MPSDSDDAEFSETQPSRKKQKTKNESGMNPATFSRPPLDPNIKCDYPLESRPFEILENDPILFSQLIKSLGIKGMEMKEVYALDDEYLSSIGKTFGLVFLFRWRATKGEDGEIVKNTGEKVWFANQVCFIMIDY